MKKRQTADDLLQRARQALAADNLDLAEWYVSSAERLQIEYGSLFSRFSDTPQKVREAIDARRATMPAPAVASNRNVSPNVPVTLAGLNEPSNLLMQKRDAVELVQRAKSAMADGNVAAAIGWYKSAVALGAKFDEGEYSPTDVRAELVRMGVPEEEMRLVPNGVMPLPADFGETAVAVNLQNEADAIEVPGELKDPQSVAVNGGDPISSSSLLERAAQIKSFDQESQQPQLQSERQRVMQLIAQAQAALDRDEFDVAEQFALRAQELRLPESAYQTGDTRPWMLLMEISKGQRRRTPPANSVANAGFPAPPAHTNRYAGNLPVVVAMPAAGSQMASNGQPIPQQVPVQQVPMQQVPAHQYANAPAGGYPSQFPTAQNLQASAVNGAGAPARIPAVPPTAPAQQQTPNAQPQANELAQYQQQQFQPNGQTYVPQLPGQTAPQYNSPPMAQNFASPPPSQMPQTTPAQLPGQLLPSTGPQVIQMPSANAVETDATPFEPSGQATLKAATSPVMESSPQVDANAGDLELNTAVVVDEPGDVDTDSDRDAGPAEVVPGPGALIYKEGVVALGKGELEEAEALFREAWKFESEFDDVTRQALQDHLQFVRQQIVRKTTTPPAQLKLNSNAAPKTLLANDGAGDLTDEIARELNTRSEVTQKAALEKLLGQITREQMAVQTMKQTDPKKAWDQLNDLRDRIAKADVDEESRGKLLQRMERQISNLETYIDENRSRIEHDERNKQVLAEIDRRRTMKVRNERKLADLVEQYNELMDSQRFHEAIVVAKKARELDPYNPVVENMMFKSQTARQIHSQILRSDEFKRGALATFNSIEEAATPPEDDWNMEFPRYWEELTERRQRMLADKQRRFTDVELQIQKALKKEVDVHFENQSLGQVMDHLAKMANVNVYIDPEGLAAEGVTSDTPVSIDLRTPVMLKSALNLILEPLHLSYVVQDEVLRITSEQVRDGDVYTETYQVADLVIPIPNFVPSYNIGLPGAIREAHRVMGQGYMGMAMYQRPMTLMADNPGMGPNSTNASVMAQMGASGMLPTSGNDSMQYGPAGAGGGSQADFDTLIELITATIEPDTWEEVGGPGAIDGFPGNLSLVVSQTQDVHERIIDLLEQLRRLQDLQITIEVRFITLNDDFFERIGIDFDFDINDNTDLSLGGPDGADSPLGSNSLDNRPNVTVGLNPTGMPTVDLDIPFRQGSFDASVPVFGGFTPDAAANIGFAILSDIEAFFLIQASTGDTRSNVLQAPKVTLFNGQTAFVSDTSQRPFVTSVVPVVGDFAAAHQPVITVLTEGTSLSVQAVVSQDRRFIRLTLVPFFSQIGDVDVFTFDGVTTSDTGTTTEDPTDDMNNVINNRVTSTAGTTVQLPTFAFTTVNTTVSVPDGGTILLGGIKRLSEGRNERGVPMLSKLPYVNRLFKNVGLGREASSLMMMVTPRIIISEEQEELQIGVAPSP